MLINKGIPIYLIAGFLEGGKTEFVNFTMQQDYFNDGEKTLLIVCEEGEEEYDPAVLAKLKATMVTVENESDLTPAFFKEMKKKYRPDRVIIEYNGMWRMKTLTEMKLPAGFEMYQIITIFDATTFQLYLNNMKSLVIDMVSLADMVIFNRSSKEMPLSMFKRSIRAVNRPCEVIFEDGNGELEDFEEELPYDVEAPIIEIAEEDFGIFYVDALDNPERYDNKVVRFKARALKTPAFPKGSFLPGRNAMTCCADDIAFIGFLCHYEHASEIKSRQWVEVTARLRWQYCESYQDEGPVLYAANVEQAQPPKEDLVYFN